MIRVSIGSTATERRHVAGLWQALNEQATPDQEALASDLESAARTL
jgi:hypothetical protein